MYGLEVYLTKGLYSNLKITTPEDIAIASEIIRSRGESEPFHD
jgi:2-C-methyl-D-erythritol 4-phosphate cytidylyltransferase